MKLLKVLEECLVLSVSHEFYSIELFIVSFSTTKFSVVCVALNEDRCRANSPDGLAYRIDVLQSHDNRALEESHLFE